VVPPAVRTLIYPAAVAVLVFGLWASRPGPRLRGFSRTGTTSSLTLPVLGRQLRRETRSRGRRSDRWVDPRDHDQRRSSPRVTRRLRDRSQAQKDAPWHVPTRWEMSAPRVHASPQRVRPLQKFLIGLGRAMGGPSVALVIGSSPQITEKMCSSGDALPR